MCKRRNRGFQGPVVAVLAGLLLAANGLMARAAENDKSASLPLKRVVLFSSGVGFFEHAGKVDGNVNVEMKFNVDDVNDLLKSMVVQDLDGGQISTVSYASKDPITKTLKTFAIDLTSKPTLAKLLEQVRGEKVEVEASQTVTGVILGVEKQKRRVDKDEVIEIDVLNLLTEDGLRAVSLDSVSRIRLLNEKLDAELRKALALLASSHSTDKKEVQLNLLGEGTRRIQVGYIQETPVWKTTYRLVLSDKEAPFLQGWAIVENTTEEDWSNVRLTLISGRPISFVMDLYEPLYLPRPTVRPQLFASLRPQTYGQDMVAKEKAFRELAVATPKTPAALAYNAPGRASGRYLRRGAGEAESFALNSRLADSNTDGVADHYAWGTSGVTLGKSAASAATAGEVGELFEYAIDTPVTLQRQKSAMLPIVNTKVKGEKVSIYNARVHAKHPLAGMKLTNATDLHLMQGPITVFDGGAYAGDAQIEDMAPGTTRLISYSIDLDTEVAPKSVGQPEQLLSVRLIKGVMIATRKLARTMEYTVKNSGKRAKTVLVEHPLDHNWKLVAPEKPTEKTRDRYRFAVEAKPGEPAVLKIAEEQTQSQHLGLTNLNDDQIRIYLRAKVVSQKVKDALAKIIEMKRDMANLANQRGRKEAEVKTIADEQSRIRANMNRLDRAGQLYKRYVKKLDDQENALEGLHEEIAKLRDQETEAKKKLDAYLLGLNIE
ncbi:MAG: hypothetical protein JW818_09035 [Pirellulales bacterium]|nr:hypothetical protein [Pirellulales bacterium]